MLTHSKDYLDALKGFITIMRDPYQTDAVFEIGKGLERAGALRRAARKLRAESPEIDRLLGDRYLPEPADLDRLMELPEGSLGRTFAEAMKRAGFDVEFYPKVPITDDASYLVRRLQQTHDIWHTVTGFGTDPAGEIGLQAFVLAQMHSPLSVVLILASVLATLGKPAELRALLAQIRRGFRMGKASKPFLAQRWEDRWERPLPEWRAAVGLPSA